MRWYWRLQQLQLGSDSNMMCYKFVVFSLIYVATGVRVGEKVHLPECEKLFDRSVVEKSCCHHLQHMKDKWNCTPKDGKLWSCKESSCRMEKIRLMAYGEVNEDKISAMMDRNTAIYPDAKVMTDRVRAKCLNGQYKEYYPKNCAALQFELCAYMNTMVECTLWKDSDECKAVYEIAAQCKNILDAAYEWGRPVTVIA